MKIIFIIFMVALTMGLSITLTIKNLGTEENKQPSVQDEKKVLMASKTVSRFLAQERNPRAADHCKRDNEICHLLEGKNSTCCNNKCMDLTEDNKNCGACKNKCIYTDTCCRGECVNLSYDKRHCGSCGNRCKPPGYCFYGMCDYA